MIDKTLLSIVLGQPYTSITDVRLRDEEIIYNTSSLPNTNYKSINLDTLQKKCKIWAHENGVILSSHISNSGRGVCSMYCDEDEMVFNDETELEAVLEATKYAAEIKGLI